MLHYVRNREVALMETISAIRSGDQHLRNKSVAIQLGPRKDPVAPSVPGQHQRSIGLLWRTRLHKIGSQRA